MDLWTHDRWHFPLPQHHRFPIAKYPHALAHGVAMNLGGGTHHAGRAFARGYCLFNDVVCARPAARGRRHGGRGAPRRDI